MSIYDTLKQNYIGAEVARRANIYGIYERYYLGAQYDSEFIKRYFRLYAQTREFYSLITRAVDIDVELVPGGWQATRNQEEIDAILKRSSWEQNGPLYVHQGAVFGDYYLKCFDNNGLVGIQPLDPRGIWLDAEKAIIARNVINTETGLKEEHAEIITNRTVTFFLNGRPINSYRHPFGFIPVFYGQNKNVGLNNGLNAFHNVIDEINAVNEMVTYLQEQTLRALINQKVITGASPSELEYGPDKTVFLPQGASIDTLKGNIDVQGTLELIKDIKTEVKNSLPELIFDSARQANLERPIAADSLRIYAQELIAKVTRMRRNYDATLKTAINAVRKMEGNPVMDFDFLIDRPVLNITPTVAV